MKYSIVIPTYNGERFVREAIESALSQTFAADEIIVSDDCSTDRTVEIAKEYEPRIKVAINADGPSGFVNGWNKAIERASCTYVSVLHQDDVLSPTFLEEVDKALKMYPKVGHIFVPCNYIDAWGKKNGEAFQCDEDLKYLTGKEYLYLYITQGNPHVHRCPGVVTKRELFKKCSYREEAGHIADDDFFMRIGNYTDVIGIMKPLASYRLHWESETGHLSNLKLSKRLARDWHFQCRHAKENVLIDDVIYKLLKYKRCRSSRRVVGSALKLKKLRDIIYGLRYMMGIPRI